MDLWLRVFDTMVSLENLDKAACASAMKKRIPKLLPCCIFAIQSPFCFGFLPFLLSKDVQCRLNKEAWPRERPSFPSTLAALVSALERDTPVDDDGRMLIDWLNPSVLHTVSLCTDQVNSEDCITVPLYPLSSIAYLPDRTANCTLRNTEPRNVQMALDLQQRPSAERMFCTVLRAVDTGCIASVGTLMLVNTVEPEMAPSASRLSDPPELQRIQRILVTCVPVATVRIVALENPLASTLEYRLQHPTEYLRAVVCQRWDHSSVATTADNVDCTVTVDATYRAIEDDYTVIRMFYMNGVGIEGLPPFAVAQLSDTLRPISAFRLDDASDFWRFATLWQTLCETVREGHNQMLMANRNELFVEAAIRKGGPLQLPVHVEDLQLSDRRRVQALELEAQQAWRDVQLDPCLDFQVLLSLSTLPARLRYLSMMIRRERCRVTTIASSFSKSASFERSQETAKPTHRQPPRGAWFDDRLW
jgi:hypothetical protein